MSKDGAEARRPYVVTTLDLPRVTAGKTDNVSEWHHANSHVTVLHDLDLTDPKPLPKDLAERLRD